MKIKHTITFSDNEEVREALISAGVPLRLENILNVKISEDDPKWPVVAELMKKHKYFEFCTTDFTLNELKSASWLKVTPIWHHGYPQPDRDFGYLDITYDLAGYCEECGIGAVQKAPFRFSREPKWGRRQILQVNWVFDEYFVTPELWKTVFKPSGSFRHSCTSRQRT